MNLFAGARSERGDKGEIGVQGDLLNLIINNHLLEFTNNYLEESKNKH